MNKEMSNNVDEFIDNLKQRKKIGDDFKEFSKNYKNKKESIHEYIRCNPYVIKDAKEIFSDSMSFIVCLGISIEDFKSLNINIWFS